MALDGWECSELSGPATWPGLADHREVLEAVVLGELPAAEHQGGSAVGQGRGVAGGDGSVRDERRAQPGQRFDGRVRPDALVGGDGDRVALALLDAHRGDLAVEDAVLRGPGGTLVRRGRHLVLGGPVDAEGQVLALGRQSHGLPVEGVGQAVVRGDVEGLDRAVGPALPGTGQQVRCAGHGLLAAGDHHRGVAAADHPGGVDHGGQARRGRPC